MVQWLRRREKGPARGWVSQAWPRGVRRSLSVCHLRPPPATLCGGPGRNLSWLPTRRVSVEAWATPLGEEGRLGPVTQLLLTPHRPPPGLWLASLEGLEVGSCVGSEFVGKQGP